MITGFWLIALIDLTVSQSQQPAELLRPLRQTLLTNADHHGTVRGHGRHTPLSRGALRPLCRVRAPHRGRADRPCDLPRLGACKPQAQASCTWRRPMRSGPEISRICRRRKEGSYLVVLLDLNSRKVVGRAMSSQADAALGQEAVCMALGRRSLGRI